MPNIRSSWVPLLPKLSYITFRSSFHPKNKHSIPAQKMRRENSSLPGVWSLFLPGKKHRFVIWSLKHAPSNALRPCYGSPLFALAPPLGQQFHFRGIYLIRAGYLRDVRNVFRQANSKQHPGLPNFSISISKFQLLKPKLKRQEVNKDWADKVPESPLLCSSVTSNSSCQKQCQKPWIITASALIYLRPWLWHIIHFRLARFYNKGRAQPEPKKPDARLPKLMSPGCLCYLFVRMIQMRISVGTESDDFW